MLFCRKRKIVLPTMEYAGVWFCRSMLSTCIAGSIFQLCVAVCCSVLQCVAVCCSVLQCVAVWLQYKASYDGWRRPIGCLKLQVIFRKRATNYSALLQKMQKHSPNNGVCWSMILQNHSWKVLPAMHVDSILFWGEYAVNEQNHTHTWNLLQHTATHCSML